MKRALFVAALLVAAAPAHAGPELPRFGLGVDLGAGATATPSTGASYVLAIHPALWIETRITSRVGVALFFPALNLALGNLSSTWLWGDAFVRVDVGRDGEGLFVEPGFGAMYVAKDVSHGVVYELPLRVGWAFRPRHGASRFDLALRPFVQAIVPSGQSAVLAYGGFVELTMLRLW